MLVVDGFLNRWVRCDYNLNVSFVGLPDVLVAGLCVDSYLREVT